MMQSEKLGKYLLPEHITANSQRMASKANSLLQKLSKLF